MKLEPSASPKSVAVVGAGPAGLSSAIVLAERGHKVTLFEASPEIGGQLKLAAKIPGKDDFQRLLRYYQTMIERQQITIRYEQASTDTLKNFDVVVIATGVRPRIPDVEGIENAVPYDELIQNGTDAKSVAVLGSGPIGFDVASFLVEPSQESVKEWRKEWGVVGPAHSAGGLGQPVHEEPNRNVVMLQRSTTRFGKALGKTTGWIHRARLEKAGVEMLGGVEYEAIDQKGLQVKQGDEQREIAVDLVAVCAGQESVNALYDECVQAGFETHMIGGAKDAHKIDAERAIYEAYELALKL